MGREYARRYRAKNPQKAAEAWQKWRDSNPEKAKESAIRSREKGKEKYKKQRLYYRKENREQLLERDRQRRQSNPEKYREKIKKWQQENREKVLEMKKAYREKNRDSLAAKHREYCKNRREKDPLFKLITNIRTTINRAIARSSSGGRAMAFLGCTIEDLKKHLEKKFKPGMSWDNWNLGGWHIDHIIPISMFDLTSADQQKICFHYTNLQPLWAKENLSKHNKVFTTTEQQIKERMAL